jgi:hypothetical protein
MTAAEFRKLALALPESIEASHMGHPDFRVKGKIFATLGPDEAWGMVKLTPALQTDFLALSPQSFEPCKGAWGRQGCTQVILEQAAPTMVRTALKAAWNQIAMAAASKPAKKPLKSEETMGETPKKPGKGPKPH